MADKLFEKHTLHNRMKSKCTATATNLLQVSSNLADQFHAHYGFGALVDNAKVWILVTNPLNLDWFEICDAVWDETFYGLTVLSTHDDQPILAGPELLTVELVHSTESIDDYIRKEIIELSAADNNIIVDDTYKPGALFLCNNATDITVVLAAEKQGTHFQFIKVGAGNVILTAVYADDFEINFAGAQSDYTITAARTVCDVTAYLLDSDYMTEYQITGGVGVEGGGGGGTGLVPLLARRDLTTVANSVTQDDHGKVLEVTTATQVYLLGSYTDDGFMCQLVNRNPTSFSIVPISGETINGQTELLAFMGPYTELFVYRVSSTAWVVIERAPHREALRYSRAYFVRTDGSDLNDGLDNTAGRAFRTIQYAVNYAAQRLDPRAQEVTVTVGAGTWPDQVLLPAHLGELPINITGSTSNPASVVMDGATVDYAFVASHPNSRWRVRGFKFINDHVIPIVAENGGLIQFGNCEFTARGSYLTSHVAARNGGIIELASSYTILGSAPSHLFADANSILALMQAASVTVTLSGTINWSTAFINTLNNSSFNKKPQSSLTFSGTATGVRYNATLNSVINTAGGGASYFPGSSAGTTATGGQYA